MNNSIWTQVVACDGYLETDSSYWRKFKKSAAPMKRKELEELSNVLGKGKKTVITWPFCCINRLILQSSLPQASIGTGKEKKKVFIGQATKSNILRYEKLYKSYKNQYSINKYININRQA